MTTESDNPLSGRLAAEAIRHLEQDGTPLPGSDQLEQTIAAGSASIEQRIVQRARQLSPEAGVNAGLEQVQRYARALVYGTSLLVFLLGCLAALQAFDQGAAEVNFYWLLLVLLGFSLLALVFWLFGLWASSTPTAGVMGRSAAWLLHRIIRRTSPRNSPALAISSAWLGVMLGNPQGRWALSSLNHVLWACYLLGGLAMIIILLSARQYDFVWGTTLLGEQAFINLTRVLGWLPSLLGIDIPDTQQVSQSRLGADRAVLATARQAWASLLMASLLLYGILPRLILLAICRLLQRRALRAFKLDTSQAYYVRLRQRLVPTATATGVVDPDTEVTDGPVPVYTESSSQQVPGDAAWLGIELGPELEWPPQPADLAKDLGRVDTRQDQHRAVQQCKELGQVALVLALPLQRSPDRGLARFIGTLVEIHQPSWLVLLEQPGTMTMSQRDARLVDWYALAAGCGIEADHIVQLEMTGNGARHG